MSKVDRGWWPIREVIAWRMDGSRTGGGSGENESQRSQALLGSTAQKAQTENRELENGIKRGDYIEKQVVADELAAFLLP